MDSQYRRRTMEHPKADAGLAEWTSKIKAMQRDVESDEEAEQRRLEEEIRASRLARSRRSMGIVMESVEISGSPLDQSTPATPATSSNREQNRSNALSKLMGEDPVRTRTMSSGMAAPSAPPLVKTSSAPGPSKPEPMSLAAFMGSKASGPRLNKPKPQQDVHDPTKFQQQTQITNPHPVFGRGGVAMPGMVAKENALGRTSVKENVLIRERTITAPSNIVDKTGPVQIGPSTRRTSYPDVPASPSIKPTIASASHKRVSEGASARHTITPPQSPPGRPYTPGRNNTPSSPHTPRRVSSSGPVVVPSLARSIQPQSKPSPTGPEVPYSKNPSPAFLKPAVQKDLTPSLSRLQGRGFVQSLVKLSTELESAANITSSPERPSSAGKRAAPPALDKWRVQTNPSSPSPPPLRKAKTVDESVLPTISSSSGPRSPQGGKSVGEMHQPQATKASSGPPFIGSSQTKDVKGSPTIPGVGSSNTLISYIKPSKTPENAVTDPPARRTPKPVPPRTDVDELGMLTRHTGRAKSELSQVPVGRPLSHPTKDRAKKPRKASSITHDTDIRSVVIPSTVSSGMGNAGAIHAASKADALAIETDHTLAARTLRPLSRTESKSDGVSTDVLSSNAAQGQNVRRLMDSWVERAPISHKKVGQASAAQITMTTPPGPPKAPAMTRVALPGLTPALPITPPLTVRNEIFVPPSPTRHSRIPSTGSRPTVMDVAQALQEQQLKEAKLEQKPKPLPFISSVSETRLYPVTASHENEEDAEGADAVSPIESSTTRGIWDRTITPTSLHAERRRTSHERYSSIMMPPLHEEKTPISSPAGTLTKNVSADLGAHLIKTGDTPNMASSFARPVQGMAGNEANFTTANDRLQKNEVHFDHKDEELPSINVQKLWNDKIPRFTPDADMRNISVEVFNIIGSSATIVDEDPHIFYDAEFLAIVHRAKSKKSGLVTTKVWSWRGSRTEAGESEDNKSRELAKRFNTTLVQCDHYAEPLELLHVLGGTLAVRQGSRSIWSSENTTMHVVRSCNGFVFIEEIDFIVRNLCSGFSFCVSVLDTLWVWHGRGATNAERRAALDYARTLSNNSSVMVSNVVEVEEGSEDEMFWMLLGDDGYANADYWKWRKDAGNDVDLRIWKIDYDARNEPVEEIATFSEVNAPTKTVFLLHLGYEIFVLVGSHARNKRRDIRLAVIVAREISAHLTHNRPFRPPVHILILPSQIPVDLRAAVRGLHEDLLNGMDIPKHMNLLTLDESNQHLAKIVWNVEDIEDDQMLPLGIAPPT